MIFIILISRLSFNNLKEKWYLPSIFFNIAHLQHLHYRESRFAQDFYVFFLNLKLALNAEPVEWVLLKS